MSTFRVPLCFSLFLAVVAFVSVRAEYVLTLTADNFTDEVAKHDFLIVEFYAPWCGHCKQLAPEYEKAAEMLHKEGFNAVLAKVDADDAKNKPLAEEYGVQGFPTLKIFRKDAEVAEYDGPREADGIVEHIKSLTGPPSKLLESSEAAQTFLKANPIAVVGLFDSVDSQDFKVFESVAEGLRSQYAFAHTTDASLLTTSPHMEKEVKLPTLAAPAVRLFKDFDEYHNDLKPVSDEKALEVFLEANTTPLVFDLERDMKKQKALGAMMERETPKAVLLLNYGKEGSAELRAAFVKVAHTRTRDLDYLMIDVTTNENAQQYFKLEDEELPSLVVHDQKVDNKYVKENVKAEDIATFLDDSVAGKIAARVASEPIPVSNDEPVKVVVAMTMKDMVVESPRNVMIEFYAPWCGHCQKLEPIFTEVATHFANDKDVLLAKMDATANDLPGSTFKVEGFPTIYFKAGDGNIIPYDKPRTKEALIEFIEANRTPVDPELLEKLAQEEEKKAEGKATGEVKEEL